MATLPTTAGRMQQGGGDWFSKLARAGLVTKGVIYLAIGGVAIRIALTGASQQEASTTGAIELIARQPFGQFLLIFLTAGLAALAVWRGIDAVRGDPVEGSEAKDRAKYAVKALLYLSAASTAFGVLAANWGKSVPQVQGGGGGGGGQAGAGQAANVILGLPFGQWLLAAAGLGVIGYAGYTAWTKGVQHDFDDWLQRDMDDTAETAVVRAGQAGYLGRALTFFFVGIFLIGAAVTYGPDSAVGVSGALRRLAGQWWGLVALYLIAAGLFLFGFFNIGLARYRRVR